MEVVTAAELRQACEQEFPGCDVLLMAAAVADFRPAEPAPGKIKKSGRKRLELELELAAWAHCAAGNAGLEVTDATTIDPVPDFLYGTFTAPA